MAVRTPDYCVSCGDAMNEPVTGTTRASLAVARVALGRMAGAPAAPGAHHSPITMATRARDAWASVETLLCALTGRADLAGQALLTEARRVDALDMDGMHALVALREWVERTMTSGSAAQMLTLPPTEAEAQVATTSLAALERAVSGRALPVASVLPAQPDSASQSQWAPLPAGDVVEEAKVLPPKPLSAWAPPAAPDRVAPPPFNSQITSRTSAGSSNTVMDDAGSKRSMSSGLLMGIVLLLIAIGGAGSFFFWKSQGGAESSLTERGAAAYARGAKEAARLAFVKAVQENPDDARALTYLGRIAREQGSTATARQYLEMAIRIEPNNALASRELASALLADQQYQLARRFYLRALTIDPSDRVAQGFLSCALFKLNRTEEAQRWMDRAGTGEWSACAPVPTAAPSKD